MVFSQRSEKNLNGVHQDLIKLARREFELSTIDFGITEGVRTAERQKQLVAEGKSQTMKSRHLHGFAIDVLAYPTPAGSWDMVYYKQIADAFKVASTELAIPIELGWRLEIAYRWGSFSITT
jgi:peptidoglycan L-alanyl-D-glutamate endopeptidase CwlK